ncbi:MAG: TPM domain-containing protein [Bacteroidota bacterium]
MLRRYQIWMVVGCFLMAFTTMVTGQQPVPKPTNYLVNDYAGLLNRQEVVQLGRKLSEYARSTSVQIVLVTENTLAGEDDFQRAFAIKDKWRPGTAEEDNGILLYVAKEERKVRIVTGYGTEGFLPDAMARRIIDNVIIPEFRNGNFYGGLDRATDAIMELGRGDYPDIDQPRQQPDAEGGPPIFLILFIIILILHFATRGNGDDDDDGGYYRGGRYDDYGRRRRRGGGGWIFLPGGDWGGGGSGGGGGFDGGGGFSGGGFGGFGGGMSGGGGAGGSW